MSKLGRPKTVYVVEVSKNYETWVDSVFSKPELADERKSLLLRLVNGFVEIKHFKLDRAELQSMRVA